MTIRYTKDALKFLSKLDKRPSDVSALQSMD